MIFLHFWLPFYYCEINQKLSKLRADAEKFVNQNKHKSKQKLSTESGNSAKELLIAILITVVERVVTQL